MTVFEPSNDPRPTFAASLNQVEHQVDALEPEDMDRPTPCEEYDVRTLIAHLVAVLRKLEVVRHGGDMRQVPDPAVEVDGDAVAALRRARTALDEAWVEAAALDPEYSVAWGTMTGCELLDAYTHEFTVHAWDLAQASGRGPELDPTLAEAAIEWFSSNVPADDRSDEGGPFGPVVPVASGADEYTRLAGFVGRQV